MDDFVRGEPANKDCPTKFHVEARRRRPPEMPYKPKVDGILEYILYWCSFGPDDHRECGIVWPSKNTYVPKKKSVGRSNAKRGRTCHFMVKRLIAEPSVALIINNQDKHVAHRTIRLREYVLCLPYTPLRISVSASCFYYMSGFLWKP